MYASLDYVYTRHPYGDIPGQVSQAPTEKSEKEATTNGIAPANGESSQREGAVSQNALARRDDEPLPPEEPAAFNATLRELAQDLILKEQQIEYIVNSLPGIGNSEADQERRMAELEQELRAVEEERRKKEIEREDMVDLLGEVIGKVKRVP